MSNIVMKHCKHCKGATQHTQASTSHVLHLILTLVTMGLWIPIWILMAILNAFDCHCTKCGY